MTQLVCEMTYFLLTSGKSEPKSDKFARQQFDIPSGHLTPKVFTLFLNRFICHFYNMKLIDTHWAQLTITAWGNTAVMAFR